MDKIYPKLNRLFNYKPQMIQESNNKSPTFWSNKVFINLERVLLASNV